MVNGLVAVEESVISAVPSKSTPLILRLVCNLVAEAALPVNSPVKLVEATEVNPAIDVDVPPKAISVVPILIDEFAKFELVIPAAPFKLLFDKPDMVLNVAEIVLFFNVSVPSRVANVPVVGSVTLVSPVVFKVVEFAPTVIKLPPNVMVLSVLSTPVPPFAPETIPLTLAAVLVVTAVET